MAREAERQQRARQRELLQVAREAQRAEREWERAQRAYERQQVSEEKERARLYVEMRQAETESLNQDLAARLEELNSLLATTLEVDDFLDFETFKQSQEIPPFEPGVLAEASAAPEEAEFLPAPLSFWRRLVPNAMERHAAETELGRKRYQEALATHAEQEKGRLERLAAARQQHEERVKSILQEDAHQHAEIDEFRAAFEADQPDAVVSYFTAVIESSGYPEGFPRHAKLAFVPESRQLVVEYDLPAFDVVPEVGAYKYVRARDEMAETARPATQRRALYSSVLAQVTIRTLHEIFEADRAGKVETVVFNGHVETVDRGTGREVRPCLVTVRTTRQVFQELDLSRIDPVECLKRLNASVSKSPTELAPVRPVLEFSMVDPRFVEETDVLSTLDQRPNLMQLTPTEFESLITNLFEKMGLETRQTQASRDGGVDCVAYDPRPIFGGKVVIQAKRYKNTVGVSAVRDLFGTVQNEGASKGILVTTSGYGSAAFDFAKGKPLELLSGSNLLYLLAEHAGIEAKIEVPDEWKDPSSDN